MKAPHLVETEQRYFEDIGVGTVIPERAFGPHTLLTGVVWAAAVQANDGPIHYDRDYARQRGAKNILVSGQLRQSYVVRMLLDWAGPRTFLQEFESRHTASSYEGDTQVCSATVVEKSSDLDHPEIVCEYEARNQERELLMRGRVKLRLPCRTWPAARLAWGGAAV